jgi:prophage regulatory protein
METLLTLEAVMQRTGFKRSAIYERIKSGTFPAPRRERGTGTVRWLESDIASWIAAWIAASETGGTIVGSRLAKTKKAA